jgi:predicted RNA binding protein YcfA (HicA-like mRNA interferase family)
VKRTYTERTIEGIKIVAQSRGWVVTYTGGGHFKFAHPEGGLVYTSSTPGDWRATRKIAAELVRQERAFGRST